MKTKLNKAIFYSLVLFLATLVCFLGFLLITGWFLDLFHSNPTLAVTIVGFVWMVFLFISVFGIVWSRLDKGDVVQ